MEEILDKMSLAKQYELRGMRDMLRKEGKDEPYLVYVRKKDDYDYLLERSLYKTNPLETEIYIYPLEKFKMRPYPTAVFLSNCPILWLLFTLIVCGNYDFGYFL